MAIAFALTALLPGLTATPVCAQVFQSSMTIGPGVGRVGPAATDEVVLASSRIDFALRPFVLRLDGQTAWTNAAHRSAAVTGILELGAAVSGPVRFTSHLAAQATRFTTAGTHALALAGTEVEYSLGGIGLFLRGGAGATRVAGMGEPLLRIAGGARSLQGRLRVELDVSTTYYAAAHPPTDTDDLVNPDTTFATRNARQEARARYSEAELRIRRRGGRWSGGVGLGARVRGDLRLLKPWGTVWSERRLSPAIALTAAGGWLPSQPELGFAGRPVASIGLRILSAPVWRKAAAEPVPARSARAVTHVSDLGAGRRLLRVPAGRSRQVEIMADFTDWQPVPLRPHDAVYWAIDLQLPAGHYRMNVRFDGGAWTVPPGLIPVADEFGGMAGALLIE